MPVLALMHCGYESAKSAVEFASITKKVGYKTTEEALIVTSFNLKLPEAFSLLPKSGIAKDSRVLPGLSTF
jgi:dUTPase